MAGVRITTRLGNISRTKLSPFSRSAIEHQTYPVLFATAPPLRIWPSQRLFRAITSQDHFSVNEQPDSVASLDQRVGKSTAQVTIGARNEDERAREDDGGSFCWLHHL